jgi:hypothetical protein
MNFAKDRIASVVILAVAMTVFVASGDFNFTSSIFPRMIASVMGFCALLMFLRTLTFRRDVPAPAASDPNVDEPFFRHAPHFLIFFAALILYLLGIEFLGYFTATALLVVGMALALGFRQYMTLGLTLVLFLALVYGVFILIFERPLPRGILY